MDRKEIIGLLNEFPYPRQDYWVITGSAMVLYGIKEQTTDIDLGCSKKLGDELQRSGCIYQYTES